jgi:hypothetical protein
VAEQVLDDVERMLDARPDLRLLALERYRQLLEYTFGHRDDRAAPGSHVPVDLLANSTVGLRLDD